MVVECVPEEVAREITERYPINLEPSTLSPNFYTLNLKP
jgi:hypothetical protein